MKNRREFTSKISQFLVEMILAGETPVIDWVLRDTETQHRFFKAGKSKCDGYIKKSRHQNAMAMDIYFIREDGSFNWNIEKYEFWHKIWQEKYGGSPMISWDGGHFE